MSDPPDPRFANIGRGIYDNLKELVPEEILGELPEAGEVPQAPAKFNPPKINPSIMFPVLAIAGAIFGIISFFGILSIL